MLATNIGTGLVVGQFVLPVVDGPDLDREPELVPMSGEVTFTPSIPHLPIIGDTPEDTFTLVMAPIKAILDNGFLCTPSSDGVTPQYQGIRLIATDAPNGLTKNWFYTVTYRFKVINGVTPSIKTHPMAVLVGSERDLTRDVDVPSSPAIGTPQAFALLAKAEAAATESATSAAVALQVKADADAGVFDGEDGQPGPPGPNTIPTQQAVADAITTPGSPALTALSGTIGDQIQVETKPLVASALATAGGLGILSDSISTYDQGATSNGKVTRNWHGILSVTHGLRVVRSGVYGTGGFTMEQIRDTHLPQLLAAADRPAAVAICGGTNNMATDATMNAGYAALLDIIQALQAQLIRPILWLAPPRGDSALAQVLKWNARVAFLARKLGLQVVDAYTPLASTTTGGIADAATNYQPGDAVHPGAAGHGKIAAHNAALPGWLDRFKDAPAMLAFPADGSNLMPSDQGLFLSDSQHAGYGNGWVAWGSGVTSKTISTDAAGIKWQRLTKAAGNAGQGGIQYAITTGFGVGDVIEMVGRVKTSTPEMLFSFNVNAFNGATNVASGLGGPNGMQGSVITDGIVRSRVTVPANTTKVQVDFQINTYTAVADSYVEGAQVAVRNLTALGLA